VLGVHCSIYKSSYNSWNIPQVFWVVSHKGKHTVKTVTWAEAQFYSLTCLLIYLVIHILIYLFAQPAKYVLSTYYVSSVCPDIEINRMTKIPALLKLELFWGRQIIN
jgi:hypothetical protein